MVGEVPWTLLSDLAGRVQRDNNGNEWLPVDEMVLKALDAERLRRDRGRTVAEHLCTLSPDLRHHPVILQWLEDLAPMPNADESSVIRFPVRRSCKSALRQREVEFRKSDPSMKQFGTEFRWDAEDMYGYGRAYRVFLTCVASSLLLIQPQEAAQYRSRH